MRESRRHSSDSIELMLPPDTRQLSFRLVHDDDHEVIRWIYADPVARRFLPDLATTGGIQSFIDRQIARYEQFGYGIWILQALNDGRVIGAAGLTWQDTDHGEVLEVGYGLASKERGNGLATEAGKACLAFGFNVLGVGRIASLVHAENLASRKVAERLHAHHRVFVHPRLGEGFIMYYTDIGDHEI